VSLLNIELHWLLGHLQPNYHTIADFRKDNPAALKNLFKLFVLFLKDAHLVAGAVVAVDGTKVRAHNSKKNNYSKKKIEDHLARIDQKTNHYLSQLQANDQSDDLPKIKEVTEKLKHLAGARIKYELLEKEIQQTGQQQVSTTDSDSRAMLVQGQVVEVAYNVQAAVDAKHKLVVATHTLNRNDRNALTAIASEAKENLHSGGYTLLSDKGYHNGRELHQCKEQNINTIVAPPTLVNSNTHGTTPAYVVDKFTYHAKTDTYTCPAGNTLRTTGTWHKKTRENSAYDFKLYRTPKCATCPVKNLCTGRTHGGRTIERSQYAPATEENKQRYHQHTALYRTRQEINEHIFGTIKRKWGYYYTNLKGLEKVNGEFSLIMTVYNLKRSINILGIPEILNKLSRWTPNYHRFAGLFINMTSLAAFYHLEIIPARKAA